MTFITGAYCPECATSYYEHSVITRSSTVEDIDYTCKICGHNWRLVIVVVNQ